MESQDFFEALDFVLNCKYCIIVFLDTYCNILCLLLIFSLLENESTVVENLGRNILYCARS